MKHYNLYIILLILLSSCQSAGFTLKDEVSDEFLVEKKNPLVMPPDFENLPKPGDFQQVEKNKQKDEFQQIISNNANVVSENKKEKTSLEESIIEKIN